MIRTPRSTIDIERLARRLHAEHIAGWATVDLDRAEQEVVLARGWPPAAPAPDDLPLGATTRIARSPDGTETIVLLEPSTEGRLAASLARHGETFLVDYLVVDGPLAAAVGASREQRLTLSTLSSGPFGPERLVAGSPAWGRHLILAAREQEPDGGRGAVTIES
jgi:hypothetical protein